MTQKAGEDPQGLRLKALKARVHCLGPTHPTEMLWKGLTTSHGESTENRSLGSQFKSFERPQPVAFNHFQSLSSMLDHHLNSTNIKQRPLSQKALAPEAPEQFWLLVKPMRLANVLICQTSLGIGRDLSKKTTKGHLT